MAILALLFSVLPQTSALAQSSVFADTLTTSAKISEATTQADAASDFLTRPYLTGDWTGVRSQLAGQGVSFDLRYTSFYQGLSSGNGASVSDFEYGGKVDAFINFDSGKMGLWEGGGFRSHLEYRLGNAPANLGGAIFAVNSALYWPLDTPRDLVATSLYFTQKLGDWGSAEVGKFNPVDLLAADPFYGGWGIDRFMNLILVAPPSGLVPVVFMGAVGMIRTDPISWAIMVFDPQDRTNDYFPGNLFKTGVNTSVTGAYTTSLAGRKTTFAVTGIYSTAEGGDFSDIFPPGFDTSAKKGSYNVSFEFKHNLQESGEQATSSWGFYFKAAVADGNPNYVQSSVIAGIGGRALFFGRPQDAFGLGLFRYNLSDVLENSLEPFTQFRDEAGVDVFYSYAATPWLFIGADIQYIVPATGGDKNALVPALRLQIRF